jgi:ABC-type branched-subunit amino acid transport system substrate-binding protein
MSNTEIIKLTISRALSLRGAFNFSMAIVALGSILLYMPLGGAVEDDEIRLGYITDLSGHGAYYGRYSAIGAMLAVEEIESRGGKISLVVEDHGFQASKAVSAAQKLLSISKVRGLVSEFSFATNAVAPLAAKAEVLFLGVSPAVSILKQNPSAFKTFLDYEHGCRAIAEYWRDIGIKRVAVLKVITESGDLCLKGTQAIFPSVTVEEFTIGSDVVPQIIRLRQKAPEAIMAPAFEGDALNLFSALKRTNWRPKIGFDLRDSLTEQVRRTYPQSVQDAVGFGFRPPPELLVDRLRARAPEISDLGLEAAALSYLHIHQLSEALKECRTTKCSVGAFAAAKPEPILEFKGWRNRIAQFGIYLYRFEGEHLQEVRNINH